MNPMDILWLLWMLVLPILGITMPIFAMVFWFFIVPKVARRLTWARLGNSNILAITDDAGYTELMVSRKGLPEGILETDKGYRFLPRPKYKKSKGKKLDVPAQAIILGKSILKGLGKPFWCGYAGKVALINPQTAAALQSTGKNPDINVEKLVDFANTLPTHSKQALMKLVTDMADKFKAKPITYVDTRKAIKENLPQMYTPSQLKALATNREQYGMEKAGRQYTPLILGSALILGLVILGIVAMVFLF